MPAPRKPPRRSCLWPAFVAALLGAAAPRGAVGQEAAPAATGTGPAAAAKRATALEVSAPVVIDGRLTDSVWRRATPITDFLQREPVEFGSPNEATEIRFLFDGDALYVGARMHSRFPDEIPRTITRRDQYGNAEAITVSVDPFLDRRTSYSFTITASGVRRDYYLPNDSDDHRSRDFTFDPVWEARVARDSLGWTAEMRIPFSQLRFNAREVQVWGLNVSRYMPQRNEEVYWVVVPRNQTGFASRFGTLVGLHGVEPQRHIELLPYMAGNSFHRGTIDAGNPFDRKSSTEFRAGGDFRVGLGHSMAVNGTVNPDFGQVEADPAELNLSAYETFFPERRPFFTEGRQYIEGQVDNYFYSRRIGASPKGSTPYDYADPPQNTTILGAAKLAGRIGTDLSVGALAAVTQREFAKVVLSEDGQVGEYEVEPLASYGVMRLQKQFGSSQSTVGLSVAGMQRDFTADSPLQSALTRRAIAGGGDWRLRFQNGRYNLSGHLGMSHVTGDTAAIRRIQTNSAHYFQRPDAPYLGYDPTRTSLTGVIAEIRGSKNAGNWLWSAEVNTQSPGFETNDMGRLQRAGQTEFRGDLNYRQTVPGGVFRRWSVGLNGSSRWSYGGDRGDTRLSLNGSGQWNNYMETRGGIWYRPRGLSDNLTRGGPLAGTNQAMGFQLNLSSNFAAPNTWQVGAEGARGEDTFRNLKINGGVGLRPSDRISLSVNPSWSHTVDPRQYLTTQDGGRPDTYDTRYIFATADQTVISGEFRLGYTFSPEFTLEMFANPFTASGKFSRHGELPVPGDRDLRVYGTDGTTITRLDDQTWRVADAVTGSEFDLAATDFNRFSFRSNVVLRWEWTRGSTLFLVWQQSRSGACNFYGPSELCPGALHPGTPSRPGDVLDAFSVPGDNYVAIKVNYWIPVGG